VCWVLPVPGAPISCHPGDGPDISALPSSVVEGEREINESTFTAG